jgi:hypothetical protein
MQNHRYDSKEDESIVKNECTLRVTHIERRDAEDDAPFFVGEARNIALNCVAISKTL